MEWNYRGNDLNAQAEKKGKHLDVMYSPTSAWNNKNINSCEKKDQLVKQIPDRLKLQCIITR